MPNPIKIIKAVTKAASKTKEMRGKKNSKGFKTTDVKSVNKITEGMYKANKLMDETYKIQLKGNQQALKGSNKDLKKSIKKIQLRKLKNGLNNG